MDRINPSNVKVKKPQPGQIEPMVKGFTFTIQGKDGLNWVYLCVEVKDRGRRKLVRLGIVDVEEIKNAEVVYVCTDENCGAVTATKEDLLPMTAQDLVIAPNVPGKCPKCRTSYCIEIDRSDLKTFPERTKEKEPEDERQPVA